MKSILFLTVLLMAISLVYAQQTTQPAIQEHVDHAVFNTLLKKYVHEGLVDYEGIRKHGMKQLGDYLKQLSEVKFAQLSDDEQLAAYINLYNATMLHAIARSYQPGFTPAQDDYKIFKQPQVRLSTGKISLNDLENNVIRPTFKDPRVHVALVCGAISCPPLLSEAYDAKTLDKVLDAKFRHWLMAEPTRNRVDAQTKTLYLSQIFNWYAQDFGGKDKVPSYISKYLPGDLSGYSIKFLDYDWSLNVKK
jgi:hypothetical protein